MKTTHTAMQIQRSRWCSAPAANTIIALCLLVAGSFPSGFSHAVSPPEFEITGNTFTPLSGDWYQVQRQSDFVSVCEGSAPCTVPDGIYTVINLTRGERFGDIQVPADHTPSTGEGIIVYPEAGWYQVQDANTYATICEGGTECPVPPGTYIVINHSTGSRNIETVSTSGGGGGSGSGETVDYGDFSITGLSITFNTNDWFQVQDSTTYASACQGNLDCEVSAGTYQVINHSTGQRWTDVLARGAGEGEMPEALIGSSNYRPLVKQALETFSGQAYDDRLLLMPYFRNSVVTGNSRGERFYDCPNGGSNRQYLLATPSSINTVETDYNNCEWFPFLPRERDVVNGSFRDTFSPGGHGMTFLDFNVDLAAYPPGSVMEVDGDVITNCCGNGVIFETQGLNYFFTYPDGSLRVSDANTRMVRRFDRGSMEGSFTMRRDDNDFAQINVQTDTRFTFDLASVVDQGSQRHLWKYTTGQLRLLAPQDGSSVVVDANTGDFNTVNVTISNAQESMSFTENWGDWQDALFCTRGRCESFTVPGQSERQPSFF